MSNIRDDQLRVFDSFERMEQAAERTVARNYARRLIEMKSYLSSLFERYEVDGKLHFDDMAQYNRLLRMGEEVRGITVALYRENVGVIGNTLGNTYSHAFTGTGQAVSRAWGNHSLIGIMREEEMQRAVNSQISGLRWAERMGLHRDRAAAAIRETLVHGLHEGESYRQMAQRLNEAVGKDVPNALRIVRTECYRVFAEARKDRLDRIRGVDMTKHWITAMDEAVRGSHKAMHGIRVPYDKDFILPNGNEGFGPGMIGSPEDDINCRCFYIVDVANSFGDDEEDSGFTSGDGSGIMGAEGDSMTTLPRYDEAVIPIEKFTEYCLSPDGDQNKAAAFNEALGYNKSNANRLIANIRHNLSEYPATQKGDLGHGMRYEVIMNLTGPNGKSANVLTGWIDDKNNGEMRLTTAHIDK